MAPQLTDSYCNLGNLYKDAGAALEAITWYRAALRVRPVFPEVLRVRIRIGHSVHAPSGLP